MIESRKNEVVETTSDITKMYKKCLAERLVKSWNETFADEDTGDVVEIERHEVLFEKGVFIDSDILQEINFFMVEGSVKEVKVSNQVRKGLEIESYASLWIATVNYRDKNKRFIYYARGVKMAYDILTDWLELKLEGMFKILSLKEAESFVVLENIPEEDKETRFYQTDVKIKGDDSEFIQTFIINTCDTDRVIESIKNYLLELRPEAAFEIKFEQIKIMPYNGFIEREFTDIYIESKESNDE